MAGRKNARSTADSAALTPAQIDQQLIDAGKGLTIGEGAKQSVVNAMLAFANLKTPPGLTADEVKDKLKLVTSGIESSNSASDTDRAKAKNTLKTLTSECVTLCSPEIVGHVDTVKSMIDALEKAALSKESTFRKTYGKDKHSATITACRKVGKEKPKSITSDWTAKAIAPKAKAEETPEEKRANRLAAIKAAFNDLDLSEDLRRQAAALIAEIEMVKPRASTRSRRNGHAQAAA